MKEISSSAELKAEILELEKREKVQKLVVKDQLIEAKHALNPTTLVKNTYSRLAEIPEVKRTLINTIIGFSLGYLSKKASETLNEESLNRLVGNLVDYSLDRIVQKDPDSLLSKGISFTRNVVKERGLSFLKK